MNCAAMLIRVTTPDSDELNCPFECIGRSIQPMGKKSCDQLLVSSQAALKINSVFSKS